MAFVPLTLTNVFAIIFLRTAAVAPPFESAKSGAALLQAPAATSTLAFKPHSNRPSYQLRALARKSVSYQVPTRPTSCAPQTVPPSCAPQPVPPSCAPNPQPTWVNPPKLACFATAQRRQVCSTCCCVFMCPLVMVVICGVLGIVVTGLINNLTTAQNVQYCSNANASNPVTLLPYGTANAPKDSTGRILLNVDPTGYCVSWYNHDYPTSYPYSPPYSTNCSAVYNPNVCPLPPSYVLALSNAASRASNRHTIPHPPTHGLNTHTPPPIFFFNPNRSLLSTPPSGWLSASLTLTQQLLTILTSFQYNFWSIVAGTSSVLGVLGSRNEPSSVQLLNIPPLVSNVSTSGFLGSMPVDYFILPASNLSIPSSVVLGSRPYFDQVAKLRT